MHKDYFFCIAATPLRVYSIIYCNVNMSKILHQHLTSKSVCLPITITVYFILFFYIYLFICKVDTL